MCQPSTEMFEKLMEAFIICPRRCLVQIISINGLVMKPSKAVVLLVKEN